MPRRLLPTELLPTALLLTALLVSGCSSAAPAPAGAGLPVPPGAQEATVVRVVDGDTLVLRGRGVGPLDARPTKVRVLLVDTPEVHTQQECLGEEASDRAVDLLPDGSTVRVQADRDPKDRFGRALLHVWNAEGVNVGEALVREGLAEVLQLDPNELHLEAFEAAEGDARSAQRGIWDLCR